jgi:fucose permease
MSTASLARRDDLPLVAIAYASFFALGFPGAILGVMTKPIRDGLGLSLETIGQYFITYSIGYIIASALTGRLIAHFRSGMLLVGSCLITTVALAGMALAPSWTIILVFSFVLGASNAVQDAGLNIVFAARFNARLMNWLHASFGLGAMTAPLVATLLLQSGADWRAGYWVITALYGVVVLLFIFTIDRWEIPRSTEAATHARSISLGQTMRLPFVWLGIGMFFILAGMEAATGQWAPSLLHEGRGIDEATAGFWTTAYWASFTVGRIFFGAVNLKVAPAVLVRTVALTTIGGVLLLWWSPSDILDLVGLLIIGFSIAPMFATLITHTQKTLGDQHGSNAIGIQMAAASCGVGLMPWLAGFSADALGLETVPPFLLAFMIVLVVLMVFMGSSEKQKVA